MEIHETTEAMIKSLIDVQQAQGEQISELTKLVINIREAMMNDKKVILKDMMYSALDKGYATPDEDERISIEYNSYVGLGGNGQIKDLYENKYLKLHIHK
ncbi:MAG: hypothetical protein Q4D29_10190 [Lachnospiraceae bacterium]|nr:hypothetical protein [Lachnospiraceae bacterium]